MLSQSQGDFSQYSPSQSPNRGRTCRLVLPPRPRSGNFDELYTIGFIPLVVKFLFAMMILSFSLSVLEMAMYGINFPASQEDAGCCGQKGAKGGRFSCFMSSGRCDPKPRAFNGCVGCGNKGGGGMGASGGLAKSWVMKLFTGY